MMDLRSFLYRIYPSVAHEGFEKLPDLSDVRTNALVILAFSNIHLPPQFENNFTPLNPRVHLSPTQLSWSPPPLLSPISSSSPESEQVDFIQGMKSMAGNGDPTQREGIAIHMYSANVSMTKKAFCNTDGDFLILPQVGRLDIQTEMGRMMVRVGELCVIQRGIKWKVLLPDGPSRGCAWTIAVMLMQNLADFLVLDIQEIYGVHYELPELGPLGGYGLANIRDFESPVAAFDVDLSPWEIVYKCVICPMHFFPPTNAAFHQTRRPIPPLQTKPYTLRRRRVARKVSSPHWLFS